MQFEHAKEAPMTTDTFTSRREVSPAAQRLARVSDWFAALAASFRWALEMQRRCERLGGRQLDHETLRRLAAETDAWVARR